MGRDLYHGDEEARRLYDSASDLLGYDLLRACEDRHGELSDTSVVQPAVVVHSVATWRLLSRSLPEPPLIMAGHSLGELSALVCAGALGFEAAVRLAERRGHLMAECPGGSMAAVFGMPADRVAEVLASAVGKSVVVANRNSHEQCVISGETEAVEAAEKALSSRAAVVKPLRVAVPAHSPLMRPAVPRFASLITQAGIGAAEIPVASCCGGEVLHEADALAASLRGQLTGCVDWPRTVGLMLEHGADTLLEVGPKTTLRDLTLTDYPGLTVRSCDSLTAVREIAALVSTPAAAQAPAAPAETEFTDFLLACLRLAVGTPNLAGPEATAFDENVRAPYGQLMERLDKLRSEPVADPCNFLEETARETLRLLRAKGFTEERRRAAISAALESAAPDVRLRPGVFALEGVVDES
jgi:[acyl-carrier-protein] S-malonyltransferase